MSGERQGRMLARDEAPETEEEEEAAAAAVASDADAVVSDAVETPAPADAAAADPAADECAKGGRKVKFPNDETIVSGYMDPPDPWGNGSCCTTEELVCAYRAACDANGVQPHKHLLDQLHGIDLSVCNDRYEMLSCRNLRLDGRHVEALEEVFKRVQFKTLDFENCGLEEDSAIALFDMIEYYESCCKLNIAGNTRIGLRGWQMCSRMLKKTPALETLDLHGIPLAEQSIPALVRSLRVGSQLVTLHLEHSNITGRNLLILVTALRINDSLRELMLADNKMVPTDGHHLSSLLKNTPSLHLLDLRNNGLQDTGCSYICDGLYEQQAGDSGLVALVLWHNQISHEAMPSVSAALAVNRHLRTLNLGHNVIGSEGVHLLRDGLLRNRTLLRLGLQWCRIACEGAVALAECLAESPQLMRLDLRDNQIKTAGLMALKLALSVNRSLVRLDLDKELKKEPNMKDYAEQQTSLLEAIYALLQRNMSLARDRELQQLDEQQRLMEREGTSSQDSLHRPKTLELKPPDLTADVAVGVAAGAVAAANPGSQQPDLLPADSHFASVTSPTDRIIDSADFCRLLPQEVSAPPVVCLVPPATSASASNNEKESEQSVKESEQSLKESEQSVKESEQSGKESEQSVKESEQSVKESEQSGKESEQSGKESEQSGKESEQSPKESEQSTTETKLSTKKSEQPTAESEQTAAESEQPAAESEQSGADFEQAVPPCEQSATADDVQSAQECRSVAVASADCGLSSSRDAAGDCEGDGR